MDALHAAWDEVRNEFGDAATPINPAPDYFIMTVPPPRMDRDGYVEFALTDDARCGLEREGAHLAAQVLDLARSGFQFHALCGVVPGETKQVPAGATVRVNGRTITASARGLTLVRSSVLKEVSIVPLGADAGTSVSIAASQETGSRRAAHNGLRQDDCTWAECSTTIRPTALPPSIAASQEMFPRRDHSGDVVR